MHFALRTKDEISPKVEDVEALVVECVEDLRGDSRPHLVTEEEPTLTLDLIHGDYVVGIAPGQLIDKDFVYDILEWHVKEKELFKSFVRHIDPEVVKTVMSLHDDLQRDSSVKELLYLMLFKFDLVS